MTGRRTVGAMFDMACQKDPARPLLTYYDDATNERTELSGATLGNWVAKTANLLVDECGAQPGQWAAVGLPPHWQTAGVLLGCWSAGLAVTLYREPADVAFVFVDDASDEWPAADRFALGLHPLALPLREVPAGWLDYAATVRTHGDHFFPPLPVEPSTMAWRHAGDIELTQADLCARALARAAELGIGSGDRVLVDVDAHPDPVDWLLAPLAAGATIVACGHLDTTKLDARAGAELVTVVVR